MSTFSRLVPVALFLCLIATTRAFGQAAFDDSQMRQSTAARIQSAHGVNVDWKTSTLLLLLDAEARLDTVARIKANHGIEFDWQQISLLQLIEAEARIITATRIASVTNAPVDWSKYSLEDLLRMESGLSQAAAANSDSRVLPFDVLFPPTSQKTMGIQKLTDSEKQALHKHVEGLLVAAAQAVAQQQPKSSQTTPPVTELPVRSTAIESKVEDEFEGWEGETVVKLLNGQIWQQTDSYYHYHYAFMPDVLIYKSEGGWKMKVEGVERAVGVIQLK